MLLSYACQRYASNPFQHYQDDQAEPTSSSRTSPNRTTASSPSVASTCSSSSASDYFPGQSRISSSLSSATETVSSSVTSLCSWISSPSSATSEDTSSSSSKRSPSSRSSASLRSSAHFQSASGRTDLTQTDPSPLPSAAGRTTFTFLLFGATSTAAFIYLVRNRRAMNRLQAGKSLAYRDARAWRKVALDLARINALAASKVEHLVHGALQSGQDGKDIARQIERELQDARKTVAQQRAFIQSADAQSSSSSSSSPSSSSREDAMTDVLGSVRSTFSFGHGMDKSRFHPRRPWESHSTSTLDSSLHGPLTNSFTCKPRGPNTKAHPEAMTKGRDPIEPARSAQEKWQRVAGISALQTATASPLPQEQTIQPQAAAGDTEASKPVPSEEWIGDVDKAILKRDLLSSQAEQKDEEGDYLLPVSDLKIASNQWTAEDELDSLIAHKPSETPAPAKDTEAATAAPGEPQYSYPTWDKFKDLEDIFMAAWDDGYGATPKPSTRVTKTSTSKQDSNEVPITWISSSSATDPSIDGAKTIPISTQEQQMEQEIPIQFQRISTIADAIAEELPAERKTEAAQSEVTDMPEPEESVYTDFIPEEPKVSSQLMDELEELSQSKDSNSEATAMIQELEMQLQQKGEELQKQKQKIYDLTEKVDTLEDMCFDMEDEAKRRTKSLKTQIAELEQQLGLFTVWAEEIQRRMGLDTPPFFSSMRKPRD